MGKDRIRLPVAAKIALQTAGATGGTPGSPTPPKGSSMPAIRDVLLRLALAVMVLRARKSVRPRLRIKRPPISSVSSHPLLKVFARMILVSKCE
jgi:hypothetical protein